MRPSIASACFTGTGLLSRKQRRSQLSDRTRQALGADRLPVLPGRVHISAEAGGDVRRHRDAAISPLGQMGQGPGIISTRQPEIHAQAQSHRPHCIAGHVLPMTRGNRLIAQPKMGVKPSLRRLVVVRHQRRDRVPAGAPACAAKISLRRA
jgi:hypothetical protein